MKNESWQKLVEGVCEGKPRALARLISRVESRTPGWQQAMKALYPRTGKARILGITGTSQLESLMAPVVPHLRAVELLPGVGHWIKQERPEEVNAALFTDHRFHDTGLGWYNSSMVKSEAKDSVRIELAADVSPRSSARRRGQNEVRLRGEVPAAEPFAV